MENPTVTPITGDLLYFFFPPGAVNVPALREAAFSTGLVDLAIFYGRDNLILSPNMGLVPGNRFAEVTENLDEMVEACNSVWREGFVRRAAGVQPVGVDRISSHGESLLVESLLRVLSPKSPLWVLFGMKRALPDVFRPRDLEIYLSVRRFACDPQSAGSP